MSSKPLNDAGVVMALPDNATLAAIASDNGFCACAAVSLSAVNEKTAEYYHRWIKDGRNAGMGYLLNYEDKRFDPRLLMPEARSMICFAMSYAPSPEKALSKEGYAFAAYALGKDYHDVMKARLRCVADCLNLETYRVFTDTAPILERYWAQEAGIGWIGRNRQLIVPHYGSMVFLGEILTDAVTNDTSLPQRNHCGNCHKCYDACPTNALSDDFDARLCLSYHTIENREDIPESIAQSMGDCVYGCDRCQTVCPHNRKVEPTTVEEFLPSETLCAMTRDDWNNLTVEQYRMLFKGSAVKRAKYEGLVRNISKVCDKKKNE